MTHALFVVIGFAAICCVALTDATQCLSRDNVSFDGTHVGSANFVNNAEACCAYCITQPGCVASVFNKDSFECQPLSDVQNQTDDEGFESFTAPLPLTPDLVALLKLTSTLSCADASWNAETPACKWAGVNCTNGRVTSLTWTGKQCNLSAIDLSALPAMMTSVQFFNNNMSHFIDFTSLPSGLAVLELYYNPFFGHLNLTCLPAAMTTLRLDDTGFSGNFDLSRLPAGIFVDLEGVVGMCGSGAMNSYCSSAKVPRGNVAAAAGGGGSNVYLPNPPCHCVSDTQYFCTAC